MARRIGASLKPWEEVIYQENIRRIMRSKYYETMIEDEHHLKRAAVYGVKHKKESIYRWCAETK